MGLITAVTLVYNAESTIWYAIAPVLPKVDEYIIVNGGPDGPSTDLTYSIIKSFNSSKIKYFEGFYGSHEAIDNWDIVQHNFAFKQCTSDWVWKVDADEIYDSLAVDVVCRACRDGVGYDYLQWLNLYFIRDTEHIRYVPPPIRCWRNFPKWEFRDLSVTPVVDEYHIQVIRPGRWLPQVFTYHYGFILPYRRQFQRIHKFIQREENEDAKRRPRVWIESHLSEAWELSRNQSLVFHSYHPRPIQSSLFFQRATNLSKLSFNVVTTGAYDRVDGVGGSELSLALCLKEFRRRDIPYTINSADSTDVTLVFREVIDPSSLLDGTIKIWWTCDQYVDEKLIERVRKCVGGYDLIFAISEYHRQYLIELGAPPERVKVINLGIDKEDYEIPSDKVRNRLIYCSQPDRGLKYLAPIYERIAMEVPDVSLVITSDKTLWGLADPGNQDERKLFKDLPGVKFVGNIPRKQLIKYQKSSEIMAYPCDYNELFCISAIECQAAGCAIVSTDIAAMSETVPVGYVGNLLHGHPADQQYHAEFAQYIISLLTDQRGTLETFQRQARRRALQLYTWKDLVYEWGFYIDPILRLRGK